MAKHPEFTEGKSIEEILGDTKKIPEDIRQAVINTGGGYVNHNLYWSILAPKGKNKPTDELLKVINETFGSFEIFKEQLNNASASVFGSEWAFVVVNQNKKLEILKAANQNSPLSDGKTPIIGIEFGTCLLFKLSKQKTRLYKCDLEYSKLEKD